MILGIIRVKPGCLDAPAQDQSRYYNVLLKSQVAVPQFTGRQWDDVTVVQQRTDDSISLVVELCQESRKAYYRYKNHIMITTVITLWKPVA
jgi:hypothetical protein